MPSSGHALFCIALCTATLPLFAQQDAPAVNTTGILQELSRLEQSRKMALQSSQMTVLGQLENASTGGSAAASLYQDARKAVDFQGLHGDASAFQQWKKDNDVLLHNKDMQTALMLQLRYLVLSIKEKSAPKPGTQLPEIMTYLQDLIAAQRLFAQEDAEAAQAAADKRPQAPSRDALTKEQTAEIRKLLKGSLTQSIFVKWLDLDSWLPEGSDWALTPGDAATILNKDVRPVLRDQKNLQLLNTWDLQLQYEADLATLNRLSHSADEFNNIERPQLLYNRALDMELLGQKNRAVTEVMTLIRTWPQHQDFETWVAKVRELVSAPAAAPAPAVSR